MIFNDIDLSPYLQVSKVSRPLLPGRRLETTEVPGMHGAYVADQGLEATELEVECYMTARSVADVSELRRLLSSALFTTGAKKLILDDEPDRYLLAWYKGGADISRNAHKPSVTLTFLCSDPVAYGEIKTASLSTSRKKINAGGTTRTWPVITATPSSGSYWRIINYTTGEFVRVDATFTGSQTIVVDMANERLTIDGTDHLVTITSDFFALDGTQELYLSSGTATIEWQERWV